MARTPSPLVVVQPLTLIDAAKLSARKLLASPMLNGLIIHELDQHGIPVTDDARAEFADHLAKELATLRGWNVQGPL